MSTVRRYWQRVTESLFYLPTLGVVLATALAALVTWIDRTRAAEVQAVPIFLRTTVDGARAILTTSAAATITVAGIVLSITVVAVQLAASQFSPRVVATVFGSRFQQSVIAIVTGAFTYDLLVLSTVHTESVLALGATRTVSVTLALALAVVSVMAIIAFIDRSVGVMQVGEIIRRITETTVAAIQSRHPEYAEEPLHVDETPMPHGESITLRSTKDGWVQKIDENAVLGALEPGAVTRFDVRTGGFVGVGSPLATVWGSPGGDSDVDRIRRAFSIGKSRSAHTDPTFGVRQLVDIALRALSPGINDPTTANEVVLHLTEILREVLVRDLPSRVVHGADGQRIFRPHAWSRSDWLRRAFQEIRTASTTQPEVARALIASMGSLSDHLEDLGLEGRSDTIRSEAALVLEGLESNGGLLAADTLPIRQLAQDLGLVDSHASEEDVGSPP
jgi:uncharacterized membrane protein